MIRALFLSFFLIFSLLAGERDISLSFNFFAANNAISLKNITSSWEGDYKTPKNRFITLLFSDFEIKYKKDDSFCISYILKSNFVLRASSDFADLLHTVKTEGDLPIGRVYDLSLFAEGFIADGLKVKNKVYERKTGDLFYRLDFSFSLLNGRFVQDLKIDGFASAIGKKSYSFLSDVEYYYSENYLYDLDVNGPKGFGYDSSLAFKLRYKKYSFDLNVDNLLGRIYWQDTPFSDVHLKSDNAVTDENGYTKYNPSVYGYEGKKKFVQKLNRVWNLSLGYEFENFSFFLEEFYTAKISSPGCKVVKKFKNFSLSLKYENLFKTFTASVFNKNLFFSFGSDDFSLSKAKAFSLRGGFMYRF